MKNSIKILLISALSLTLSSSCEKEELFMEDQAIESIASTNNSPELVLEVAEVNHPIKFAADVDPDCKFVNVCDKKGKLKSMPLEGVYSQIRNGGMLFSCDADEGLNQDEVMNAILPYIIADGGDVSSFADQKTAFITWYSATYCGIGSPIGGGGDSDGGTFEEGGGSDL